MSCSTYLKEVVRKTEALETWIETYRGGKFFASPVHLTDLFNLETFLNAFRQYTSRQCMFNSDIPSYIDC